MEELGESVIIIHATRHFMCFLQFDISQDYLDKFDRVSPINPNDPILYFQATPWFDLTTTRGRNHVVSNTCAMIRLAKA
ncbi:hypothetical protein G6O67_005032 [Ophiocordyceps sinensis]|uniref:Uncharacterized protein n=1 Tax=Ophiocordyceps sinensis TaxID=72228 RepID=A0A8H4V5I8_9HYPO|nr:hypothetical protein G6O67_005032 [Ophiocordyceps sinensis]